MVKKLPVSIKGHADTQRQMEWKVLCLGGPNPFSSPEKNRQAEEAEARLRVAGLGRGGALCIFLHVNQDKQEHSCMSLQVSSPPPPMEGRIVTIHDSALFWSTF